MQIGQLATSIREMKSQCFGQLPSQPISNLRGNVSVVMLRSKKELKDLVSPSKQFVGNEEQYPSNQALNPEINNKVVESTSRPLHLKME